MTFSATNSVVSLSCIVTASRQRRLPSEPVRIQEFPNGAFGQVAIILKVFRLAELNSALALMIAVRV